MHLFWNLTPKIIDLRVALALTCFWQKKKKKVFLYTWKWPTLTNNGFLWWCFCNCQPETALSHQWYQVNSIQDNHWNSKLVSELRDLLMQPLILANAIKLALWTACQMSQPRKLFSLRKEIKTFILIHIVFLPSVCSWEPCQAVWWLSSDDAMWSL